MTKRGKVLRDTTSGPGLLMIEGQQYHFSLEGEWKSEAPPKPGLVVDVELDARGKVQGITLVPESQLAKERAEAELASWPKDPKLASSLVAKIGMPTLAAAGILAAAWFFLTAASIRVPFPGKLEFTFWQILGYLNTGKVPELLDGRSASSTGFYGFVAIATLLGPFIYPFWNDKRALLGGLLPLVFMIVVAIAVRSSIHGALGDGNADVGKQTHDETMKAVSLGLGTYLSILASLYFAFNSARGFLAAKASEGEGLDAPQRKAA